MSSLRIATFKSFKPDVAWPRTCKICMDWETVRPEASLLPTPARPLLRGLLLSRLPQMTMNLTLDTLKQLSQDETFINLAADQIAWQTIAEAIRAFVDRYERVVFDAFETRERCLEG